MSREEAATVYLDNLLGFHGNFHKYHEAAETLTGDDKSILERAVSGNQSFDAEQKGKRFF